MHEKARDAKRLNFEAPIRRPHNHKAPTQPQGAHVRCHGLGLRCGRQKNAKMCDKNFLISARKKPSRPQNQKFCILKNITRLEIEFGVE